MDVVRTDRWRRERQFYEEFSRRAAPTEISFDPIRGHERRPWNSYWFVCEVVMRHFASSDQRLLDFGCGPGVYALRFAQVGYDVFGFDVSPNNIAIATRLARKYALEGRAHFAVGLAEECAYPSDHFDLVVGIDILHHVQIRSAVREALRVLKPGGLAIFREPVEAPIFDRLRNTRFARWLVPKTPTYSCKGHITADERKLRADDLVSIRKLCRDMSVRRFRLFSRLDRFVRRDGARGPSTLEMVDERIFRACPALRPFGGEVVLTLRK